MSKLLLLRYDTECTIPEDITGFLEKAVEIHRKHRIPATFFCTGKALEVRETEFIDFRDEVRDDPLFDLQDHSYSHIGVGYRDGKPVEELKSDYEKSFAAHEKILGKRPTGISRCGTSGKDGPKVSGFDATEKAGLELSMLYGLGVRMINTHITGRDETRDFSNYGHQNLPDMMGFPSGYSDTSWMHRREFGEPFPYILGEIQKRSEAGDHLPIMLHDWCAWNFGDDKELGHVARIADQARKSKYKLVTHIECYHNAMLWKK